MGSALSDRREREPVELTVFSQLAQDSVATLNTITVLCRAVSHFAFFDLLNGGLLKE